MDILSTLFSVVYSILYYNFNIWGFQFSLMNFAIWSVLAYFLLRVIFGVFK